MLKWWFIGVLAGFGLGLNVATVALRADANPADVTRKVLEVGDNVCVTHGGLKSWQKNGVFHCGNGARVKIDADK